MRHFAAAGTVSDERDGRRLAGESRPEPIPDLRDKSRLPQKKLLKNGRRAAIARFAMRMHGAAEKQEFLPSIAFEISVVLQHPMVARLSDGDHE